MAVARDAPPLLAPASAALVAARDHLLGRQDPAGWWKGELETNVTMEAEDLLLRHALGILTDDVVGATARWIRGQQRDDGTWANFRGAPPDVSTTVEAYAALRLAGDDPAEAHMAAARRFVLAAGGVEATRVFTRVWLALVGQWSWDDLPAMVPEVVLLPPSLPLNIYDFGCWARQTVVALTVVAALRPVRPLPFGLDELRTGRSAGAAPRGLFAALDRVLRGYERLAVLAPLRAGLRHLALRRAERWILHRQEADGSWGGIQPPWVYSLLALHLLGYPIDHPVMRAGLAGLERFTVREDNVRRLEACQSPVWDTALAIIALADAGLGRADPALIRAADWLVGEEVRVTGDWAVRRPGLEPSGWAFEFDNDCYPDVDDTAEVVMALRRCPGSRPEAAEAAVARAVRWTLGMECRRGGWAAFDADNVSPLPARLPFCDFGEVTDPPSADVTAHVVEMLATEPATGPGVGVAGATSRGVGWLLAEQEADGSWFGRWGVNHVYGTGAVVPALVAAGLGAGHPAVRAAVGWLEAHQNPDGGWGEDCRSYDDPAWVGRGASTASQTAWALLALLAAGAGGGEAARRGVEWLVATQTADGTWDEPWHTGTGFPGDFFINYHLYRHVFPLTALGRYVGQHGGVTL
jgi:squalene-hopene/tetraprenyl-beta-curcumene cyclase